MEITSLWGRRIKKRKPVKADLFLHNDDPKASSVESANMKDICSCIHQFDVGLNLRKHLAAITGETSDQTLAPGETSDQTLAPGETSDQTLAPGRDSNYDWNIKFTEIFERRQTLAKFSDYNRDPKAKSANMNNFSEFLHKRSRGSGETSDQTFAPGGDSEHYWDIMKIKHDGAVEAKFSCYNRDPKASSAKSANMEDICSCVHQYDRSAVTTTAPPGSTLPLAATSRTFDSLHVHIVYVMFTVAITVIFTGFIKGPLKNLWDYIVSKIRQLLRKFSDRDQPEEEELTQVSSDHDQPEEEEEEEKNISPDHDQPEEEEKFIDVSKPSVTSSTNVINMTMNLNVNLSPVHNQPFETSL